MTSLFISKSLFFSLSSFVSISTIIKLSALGILYWPFKTSMQFPKLIPEIPFFICSLGSNSSDDIICALKSEQFIIVEEST